MIGVTASDRGHHLRITHTPRRQRLFTNDLEETNQNQG